MSDRAGLLSSVEGTCWWCCRRSLSCHSLLIPSHQRRRSMYSTETKTMTGIDDPFPGCVICQVVVHATGWTTPNSRYCYLIWGAATETPTPTEPWISLERRLVPHSARWHRRRLSRHCRYGIPDTSPAPELPHLCGHARTNLDQDATPDRGLTGLASNGPAVTVSNGRLGDLGAVFCARPPAIYLI
jgi:hypothetical protein